MIKKLITLFIFQNLIKYKNIKYKMVRTVKFAEKTKTLRRILNNIELSDEELVSMLLI